MDAATRDLMMDALNAAKMAGASYADVRIGRYLQNFVSTREQQITNVVDTDSIGAGVRALVDGTWGFAATRTMTKDAVAEAARKAVAVAKATRIGRSSAIELAPAPAFKDVTWKSDYTIDPWTIPIEQKADLLLKANANAMKAQNVKFVFSGLFFRKNERNYANTDGTVVTQTIIQSWAPMPPISRTAATFRSRWAGDGSTSSPRISRGTRSGGVRRRRRSSRRSLSRSAAMISCSIPLISGSRFTSPSGIRRSSTVRADTRRTTPAHRSSRHRTRYSASSSTGPSG
jgi:predicted Zn-dependent protease